MPKPSLLLHLSPTLVAGQAEHYFNWKIQEAADNITAARIEAGVSRWESLIGKITEFHLVDLIGGRTGWTSLFYLSEQNLTNVGHVSF